jgi:AraC-like DNA-binding protein
MSQMPATRYHGDFIAWPGVCGFIGEGGAGGPSIQPHAHYAIQLALGAPKGLRVQHGRHGEWQSCAGALVPSRSTHSIDVSGCEFSLVLFIEPETPAGRALAARLQGQPELLPDEVLACTDRLAHAWRVERSHDAVREVCTQLLQSLSGTAAPQPSDPRVLAAIERIHGQVDQPITLPDLAQAAHLSPGRFRHLFVEQTGMPLRTYLLWRRLLHVWTLLAEGESLAGAAHAAGFADSAHLSRTARTMFGLPPSVLQVKGPLSTARREAAHHRATTTGPVSVPRKAARSATSAGDS